jgi:hypothetical protein
VSFELGPQTITRESYYRIVENQGHPVTVKPKHGGHTRSKVRRYTLADEIPSNR